MRPNPPTKFCGLGGLPPPMLSGSGFIERLGAGAAVGVALHACCFDSVEAAFLFLVGATPLVDATTASIASSRLFVLVFFFFLAACSILFAVNFPRTPAPSTTDGQMRDKERRKREKRERERERERVRERERE